MSYYSKEEKTLLLNIARTSINTIFVGDRSYKPSLPVEPKLLEERAVFVTLKIDGELRGCIGQMFASEPLYLAVANTARSSAFKDSRFYPLTENEFKKTTLEISVLTPMQRVESYKELVMGVDGVWLKNGRRSGVFLPQVATETGWDLDSFLGELCSQKAGLPRESYKNKETEIYKFQVELF